MDPNTEDAESQNVEDRLHHDAAQYKVSYPKGRNTKQADDAANEECNKKRYPVSRSGNNPGRVKRVVSCKRKTHHLTVARRKQLGSGRTCDAPNKENETKVLQGTQQDIFSMDPWDFPFHVNNINNNQGTDRTGCEEADYCVLTELTRDHNTLTDVLFGRNLRLKVALTLWQRNVGELLTYFLSIDEDSSKITIGCCVDLFPLVSKVLSSQYEEHLTVGLKWVNSVLKNWWEDLKDSGFSGSTNSLLDENFQVFNQQLWELWQQEPFLKSVPGPAGDMAKVIDSFLSKLTCQQ
ncbi:KATNB1-like protein 1 isoform X2 [Pundamilia nyererei]|uniref:KATNB1-like protein 1 isoform X2 n=1 Tax=Pundamilia nyererei TaxID=303518 RepID=A0A9Y3RV99_9CICH|nr:PREDICTED: KATNB1-like protein 1 isoform X2 [Pundamilia nyererei]